MEHWGLLPLPLLEPVGVLIGSQSHARLTCQPAFTVPMLPGLDLDVTADSAGQTFSNRPNYKLQKAYAVRSLNGITLLQSSRT